MLIDTPMITAYPPRTAKPRFLRCIAPILAALLMLAGCGTTTVKSTTFTHLEQETAVIPESQLLDLGVIPFDPGLDEADEDEMVRPEVRNAESRYFASQLVATLQNSGAWGPVRVIPGVDTVVDVYVEGTILHSDGEKLELAIVATDASGKQWLNKTYEEVASVYAYDKRRTQNRDPFQGLFNRIANDLRQQRDMLPAGRAEELRTVSQLRFARTFAPDAYDQHIRENRKGELEIVRLPASNDPIMQRIERIRERDYLFVDTLQEHYDTFKRQMDPPYQSWRAESYEEVIAARQLKKQSTARMVGGIAAVAGGILAATSSNSATQVGGIMAAGAGGMLIKSSLEKRQEAQMHIEALAELGESLEVAIEPRVIELEDRTITLTGNAKAQYAQWKALLKQIYDAERGIDAGQGPAAPIEQVQ